MKLEVEKSMIIKQDIPETHQNLVMERFEEIRKNPERLLDWDEAKEKLKAWKNNEVSII